MSQRIHFQRKKNFAPLRLCIIKLCVSLQKTLINKYYGKI